MGRLYIVPAFGVLFAIWAVLFVPWEIAARRKSGLNKANDASEHML
jgi:hypothetical protein